MSQILKRLTKDGDERLDYVIDWSADLNGETVSSTSWASAPTGLTHVSSTFTSTTTTVVLSAGTDGIEYRVENTMTDSAGLIRQVSFLLRIIQ